MDEEGLQDMICLNDNQYKIISVETTDSGWFANTNCDITSFTQIEYFVKEYMKKTGETLKL